MMNLAEKITIEDTRHADALRFLAADAVEQAQSGHPGAPMGMADIAQVLWRRHLSHNPADPGWFNRDRFVLSNGHGSMLLYALLHLTGYDLPLSEIRQFRQLHSRTPGHPEVGLTPGVETTTGPLGQGLANAVGMALAEKLLARRYNHPGHMIVDHYTYVFVGDGCLMEGISHEACSLAGTLGLGKLICFYDDNGISIDGDVAGWFGDDTAARFSAYNWNVIANVDGHDAAAIDAAIFQAKSQPAAQARPTLICCRTHIGHGAPTKAGSHAVHGAPLGADEIAAMRAARNWPYAEFELPQDVVDDWNAIEQGAARQLLWQQQFDRWQARYPEDARELARRLAGDIPDEALLALEDLLDTSEALHGNIATRKASQIVLEAITPELPGLFGGSADLSGSNLTNVKSSVWVNQHGQGNYLSYGVREFGMAAVMNGLALHGGFIPYGGTFLTFSDYSRNAIRMAALMKQRVVHVFTHDSIGLGEDGPTHQPVEHLSALRIIPNNRVWRPCDGEETAIAWQQALQRKDGPTCLMLSRQNLTPFTREKAQREQIARGGYILQNSDHAQAVLIATGSEVGIAIKAAALLREEGVAVRVVSMPCVELFFAQPQAWRDQVLPADIPRVSIEAGSSWFWRSVVNNGIAIGIDTFGESAPAGQLYDYFGLNPQAVCKAVYALLDQAS
jgi:transketolase